MHHMLLCAEGPLFFPRKNQRRPPQARDLRAGLSELLARGSFAVPRWGHSPLRGLGPLQASSPGCPCGTQRRPKDFSADTLPTPCGENGYGLVGLREALL